MKVFTLRSDYRFQTFFPYDPTDSAEASEIVKADILQGRTAHRTDTWTPVRLYPQEEAGKPLGDFARIWGYGCFALNQRSMDLLKPILEAGCEFLPFLPFESETYYRLNVLQRVDCLDHQRTRLKDGKGTEIVQYHFDSSLFNFPNLFMLPSGPRLFTVEGRGDPKEELKSIVESERLTGLKFEEVWVEGGPAIRLESFVEKYRPAY